MAKAGRPKGSGRGRSSRIDIRDRRIGRLNITAGTTSKTLLRQYKESVRKLIARGDLAVIDLLRQQKIHITEVDNAVRDGDYQRLLDRTAFSAGTIGDAVDTLMGLLETSREPATVKAAGVQTRALVAHFTKDKALESVTLEDAQDFMKAKGWGATMQKAAAGTFARIWRDAGARTNPWLQETRTRKGLVLPRQRKARHAFLLPEQWTAFARANQGLPELAPAALGALAGLRVGEVAHLRMGIDVDLERRLIRVQPRRGPHPWKPKTDNSVRDVPMSAELWEILNQHKRRGYSATYVVRRPNEDTPLTDHTLGRWFAQGLKRAGLAYGRKAGFTTHSLRRSFGSWLAQRDVQLLKIARLLGDTVEVVAEHYAYLLPSDLDRAIDIIDDVVRKAA